MQNIFWTFASGGDIGAVMIQALVDVLVVFASIGLVAAVSQFLGRFFFNFLSGATGSTALPYMIATWFTYPGVLFHELSHALFAFITGAKIKRIALLRTVREDGSIELGHVEFIPSVNPVLRSFQQCMAAVAPSVTGLAAIIALIVFARDLCGSVWWAWVLWVYAMICLVFHSGMSRQDVYEAGRGAILVAVVLFCVFLCFPVDLLGAVAFLFANGIGAAAGGR